MWQSSDTSLDIMLEPGGDLEDLRCGVRDWCAAHVPVDWRDRQRGVSHERLVEFMRWWGGCLREAGLLDDQLNPVLSTRAEREVRQTITQQTGITEEDPLFGPLLKQVKTEMAAISGQMKTELESLSNSVKQIGGVTQQAVKGYLGDHYDQVYKTSRAALPESVRDKYPLDKVIEYATQRQLTDQVGRLNIARALDQMSWDDVKAAERKDFEASRKQLEEDRQALSQMGRPQPSGPRHNTGFKGTDDKGRTLSLDEAIAAAGNDSEIWDQALKTATTTLQ